MFDYVIPNKITDAQFHDLYKIMCFLSSHLGVVGNYRKCDNGANDDKS